MIAWDDNFLQVKVFESVNAKDVLGKEKIEIQKEQSQLFIVSAIKKNNLFLKSIIVLNYIFFARPPTLVNSLDNFLLSPKSSSVSVG